MRIDEHSIPKIIIRSLDKILKTIEETILTFGTLGLAIITIGNVVSRNVFNYSWVFTEEVSLILVIMITFVGSAYAARRGRHIRMSAIYDMFSSKRRKVIIIVISFITVVFLLYLTALSLGYVLKTRIQGSALPTLRIAYFYIYLCVPIGLFLMAMEFCLTIVKNFRTREKVYISVEKEDTYQTEETTDQGY